MHSSSVLLRCSLRSRPSFLLESSENGVKSTEVGQLGPHLRIRRFSQNIRRWAVPVRLIFTRFYNLLIQTLSIFSAGLSGVPPPFTKKLPPPSEVPAANTSTGERGPYNVRQARAGALSCTPAALAKWLVLKIWQPMLGVAAPSPACACVCSCQGERAAGVCARGC